MDTVLTTLRQKSFRIDDILGRNINSISEYGIIRETGNKSYIQAFEEKISVTKRNDSNKTSSEVKQKKIRASSKTDKSAPSYTSIIAQAILSSKEKKLSLGNIYDYIVQKFPEFQKKGQGWRNCVRHNLSLSECFIKAGRARNGRGNYWCIHPRYFKNFSKGDYRKRRANNRQKIRDLEVCESRSWYSRYVDGKYALLNYCSYNENKKRCFSIENILSSPTIHKTSKLIKRHIDLDCNSLISNSNNFGRGEAVILNYINSSQNAPL